MPLLEFAVVAVLAVWALATVIHHVPPTRLPGAVDRVVNRGAWSWLVPTWNFFAPRPGVYNYHFLYRDVSAEGRAGRWREIGRSAPHAWYRPLWNPHKTHNKVSVDLAMDLAQCAAAMRESPASSLQLTIPYLSLLAYVTRQPREAPAHATQFMVLQRSRSEDNMVLLSGVHRLDHAA